MRERERIPSIILSVTEILKDIYMSVPLGVHMLPGYENRSRKHYKPMDTGMRKVHKSTEKGFPAIPPLGCQELT